MSANAESAASREIQTAGPFHIGTRLAMAVGIAIALLGVAFHDGLRELIDLWSKKEEYSHAYLIPLISIFLAWQKKEDLSNSAWSGSWLGFSIVLLGVVFLLAGSLSTIYIIIHYALILTIAGTVLSLTGWSMLRYLWVALVFLIFMVPLPAFLYQAISTKLQLISSELGVAVIRMFGVSVFLEGNVIDLGSYKLQVVEACNGLRYLFPLASFGFLCAYLYRGPIWHKAVIFLSTIPITVFMNSFRIGVIGVTVDRFGQEAAEGFLHDFEGWAIFMACLAVLFVEIWILSRLQKPARNFGDTFYLEIPSPSASTPGSQPRIVPRPFIATAVALLFGVVLSLSIGARQEAIPDRTPFSEFPTDLEEWHGQPDTIEQIYLDVLKLSDYLLIDYSASKSDPPVNLYIAYYESQRAGESAHSPRSCIPGGGWEIKDLKTIELISGGDSRPANRVRIAMGDNRQLVYYWFEQRGRYITNEYLVKWYLFWDSLTRNRSDGALIRLTTPIAPGEDWDEGDKRIQKFAEVLGGKLDTFVPE